MTKPKRIKKPLYPEGPLTTRIPLKYPRAASADLFPESRAAKKQQKAVEEWVDELDAELDAKLELLAQHYKLGANWSDKLLLKFVCKDFIEGFRTVEPKVRKKKGNAKWSPIKSAQFLVHLELARELTKYRDYDGKVRGDHDRDALAWLATQERYLPPSGRCPRTQDAIKKAVDRLEPRLSEANRSVLAPWVKRRMAKGSGEITKLAQELHLMDTATEKP